MKILIYGDIIGRQARNVIFSRTPALKEERNIDFVISDADNAAHGFGVSSKIAEQFLATGTDVITTGNHVWDQKEIIPYFAKQPRILRAANFPEGTPGAGAGIFVTGSGLRVAVIHLLGTLFMKPVENPFTVMEKLFGEYRLKDNADAIVIDFHAEITSEKNAFGSFCDGRASAVVGTHTHIPTADYTVLPKGTAYVTDIGMCGDYDSVIGMDKNEPIRRFITGERHSKLEPATGTPSIHAVLVTVNDNTGLAESIEKLVF